MRATFRLGRVAGIPVGIHWSLLVFGVLLTASLAGSQLPAWLPDARGSYWAAAVIASALFFASILAHELAHAIVARHFGQKVEDITLWLLGGVSRLGTEAPTPKAEFSVAVAGPATSAALGALFFVFGLALRLGGSDSLLAVVFIWLGAINALLAVFNLLPGSPLDGGRVVTAALWKIHGDRRRAQIGAARAGRVVGALLIVAGLFGLFSGVADGGLWTALIGWFIFEASRGEEQAAIASRALDGRRAADVMTPGPTEIPDWVSAGDIRNSVPAPPPHQHTMVLRGFDGSVHAVVPVESVRNALATVPIRNLAQPAIIAPPDAPLLDVLRDAPPVGGVVVMAGERVLGVIGPDELRALDHGDVFVSARG